MYKLSINFSHSTKSTRTEYVSNQDDILAIFKTINQGCRGLGRSFCDEDINDDICEYQNADEDDCDDINCKCLDRYVADLDNQAETAISAIDMDNCQGVKLYGDFECDYIITLTAEQE